MNRAATLKAQADADAAAWQRIKGDEDAWGWFRECNLHPGAAGHMFLTHCVICPEDTGNGKISEAARKAAEAEADARFMAQYPVPF